MELGEALAGTREQYSDVKAREVNEEEGEHVQVRRTRPRARPAVASRVETGRCRCPHACELGAGICMFAAAWGRGPGRAA